MGLRLLLVRLPVQKIDQEEEEGESGRLAIRLGELPEVRLVTRPPVEPVEVLAQMGCQNWLGGLRPVALFCRLRPPPQRASLTVTGTV